MRMTALGNAQARELKEVLTKITELSRERKVPRASPSPTTSNLLLIREEGISRINKDPVATCSRTTREATSIDI
jgi:hypothetical protein